MPTNVLGMFWKAPEFHEMKDTFLDQKKMTRLNRLKSSLGILQSDGYCECGKSRVGSMSSAVWGCMVRVINHDIAEQ